MQKLPVDISTFSELRTLNYLYVDKTKHAYNLITGGRRYFLSRPRRFGKSLFVSTLNEILTAKKSIFDGLYIAQSDYEWKEWGVINLDFSRLEMDSIEILEKGLINHFLKIAHLYNVTLDAHNKTVNLLFEDLVEALYEHFGRVAVLIDEYDSPILYTLYNPELATLIRNKLQKLFSAIKSLDNKIQFVFITGVSSFAKAGIFSGVNNLQILTFDKQYADICGYTDAEIDYYFTECMQQWAYKENVSYDNLRQQIKKWYNGYHFGKNVIAVYNPFSVLNALRTNEFENFWFQSGTPTFLVELLKKQYVTLNLEKPEVTKDFLGIFDVGTIPAVSLMFQAGYLTIVDYDVDLELYQLDWPNEEVRVSFQKYLFEVFAHIDADISARLFAELKRAFVNQDIEKVISVLKQLFAHIPYQLLHSKEEKYYHALFMMICIGAGIKAQSEYSTNIGSIDLILEFSKIIYVVEVKFNKPVEEAMDQIEDRRYYERFINENKTVILLGLVFKREPQSFEIVYDMKKIKSI